MLNFKTSSRADTDPTAQLLHCEHQERGRRGRGVKGEREREIWGGVCGVKVGRRREGVGGYGEMEV